MNFSDFKHRNLSEASKIGEILERKLIFAEENTHRRKIAIAITSRSGKSHT